MNEDMKNESRYRNISMKDSCKKHSTFSYLIRALEYELNGPRYSNFEETLFQAMKRVYKVYVQTKINDFEGNVESPLYRFLGNKGALCICRMGNLKTWKDITECVCELDLERKTVHKLISNEHNTAMVCIRDILISGFCKAKSWNEIELVGRAFENSSRVFGELYSAWSGYCDELRGASFNESYCAYTYMFVCDRKNEIEALSLDELFPSTQRISEGNSRGMLGVS